MVNFPSVQWNPPKMPAISNSFNRYLRLIMLTAATFSASASELPALSASQREWLGEQIFRNECNARFECLTSWNEGESFPSLGLGHFIWYRADQTEIFEETFPLLLAYYREQKIALPDWLESLPSDDSPWLSRDAFLAAQDSPELTALRQFLADTRAIQVDFIGRRLQEQLPALLAATPASTRDEISRRFFTIANASPPYGLYALIDYLHFKGSGLNSAERYAGQGWGLLQVLMAMPEPSLPAFSATAAKLLQQRVQNAPTARNEQRWLAGWQNRVRGYLPAATNE
jgi:hypothetical protein